MKYRVCGSKSGGNSKLNPFFEVDVRLFFGILFLCDGGPPPCPYVHFALSS